MLNAKSRSIGSMSPVCCPLTACVALSRRLFRANMHCANSISISTFRRSSSNTLRSNSNSPESLVSSSVWPGDSPRLLPAPTVGCTAGALRAFRRSARPLLLVSRIDEDSSRLLLAFSVVFVQGWMVVSSLIIAACVVVCGCAPVRTFSLAARR
uniref:Transmembrane protein n=1 Tax=Anopheles atroparvus TaxID=41427 RepID=A0AAG5DPS2_ANOAO